MPKRELKKMLIEDMPKRELKKILKENSQDVKANKDFLSEFKQELGHRLEDVVIRRGNIVKIFARICREMMLESEVRDVLGEKAYNYCQSFIMLELLNRLDD